MIRRLIVISGAVCAGKTTLALELENKFNVKIIKTRYLLENSTSAAGRHALQASGEQLDKETKGAWLAKAVEQEVEALDDNAEALVDSVRIADQIEALRNTFGPRVVHVHLSASIMDLEKRYIERKQTRTGELESYAEVAKNATEGAVDELRHIADVVIDTDRCDPNDVLVRAASYLGYYGRTNERIVDVMVGGQWGSEGKGNFASYLAQEYDILVRVGGPNAGHKVYLGESNVVTFRSLPSGTLHNSSASIIIAPGSTIYVPVLLKEIADHDVHYDRLAIDPQVMVIDEFDRDFEQGLKKSIGSTAQGVGSATARRILRNEFPEPAPKVLMAKDVEDLKRYIKPSRELLDDAFRNGKRVFVEGTQGTALSIYHGEYPFTTSRDTTVGTCLAESGISPTRLRRAIMVCRTYPIRVKNPPEGYSGPMGKEISLEELANRSGIEISELQKTELSSVSKNLRRIAEFNWHLLRQAASINGPTDIALSFADYIDIKNKDARRFEQLTPKTIQFIEEVERVSGAPVTFISTRFEKRNIIDRRKW